MTTTTPSAAVCTTQAAPASHPTIHHPRPAIIATAEGCGNQRRFGAEMPLRVSGGTAAEVLRFADDNVARLKLEYGVAWCATAVATPVELRELAARLIDAAHDIETFPAALQESAAA